MDVIRKVNPPCPDGRFLLLTRFNYNIRLLEETLKVDLFKGTLFLF